ncbi:hypothetical protein LLB_1752 [Legionella longbeachae D-4968]|nr:hypothetical protein LLB_1752 [Legionella longbeachae D-4968]
MKSISLIRLLLQKYLFPSFYDPGKSVGVHFQFYIRIKGQYNQVLK